MLRSLLLLVLLISGCATQAPWEKTDPQRQAEAYANLGMGYLREEEYTRSLRNFNRALEVRPEHEKALHGMALALQAQAENQLAENYFKKVLQVNPRNTAARNNYAAFLFEQNRYDEARIQLQRASEDIFYSDRALIFENLGYVALEQNDPEAAKVFFKRCLTLDARAVNAHRELLRLYLPDDPQKASNHWQFLQEADIQDKDSLTLGLELAKITGNQQEQERLQQLLANH
ncbi:tetratricopeptide repeat protein [Marinospirillum perlucidum]|uniref:tetratricopeptide repeat protein n=1 Tax=Marinospirillum perlucidum TaxID=1982602 RepID=UPI0013905034|nr:tetratricopeptide repeat protein [Marinospirillum perlucidum]